MSAMKRDASRRWRLLTCVGAQEGCWEVRLVVVVELLRVCLDFALSGLDEEAVAGGIVADRGADLLLFVACLLSCAGVFANVTARF
jgi:hypothetical protein